MTRSRTLTLLILTVAVSSCSRGAVPTLEQAEIMTTVRVMEAATVLGVDLDDIDIRNRVTGANCDAGFTAVQAEAHLVTPTLQPEVFDDLVAYWRAVYADILTYSNDPRSGLMVSATIELRDGSWVAAGLGTPTGRLSVYASTVCAHYPRPNDQ